MRNVKKIFTTLISLFVIFSATKQIRKLKKEERNRFVPFERFWRSCETKKRNKRKRGIFNAVELAVLGIFKTEKEEGAAKGTNLRIIIFDN